MCAHTSTPSLQPIANPAGCVEQPTRLASKNLMRSTHCAGHTDSCVAQASLVQILVIETAVNCKFIKIGAFVCEEFGTTHTDSRIIYNRCLQSIFRNR